MSAISIESTLMPVCPASERDAVQHRVRLVNQLFVEFREILP
jgi:Trp operon repressor